MSQKILRIFTIIVIGITSFGLLVGVTFLYDRFIYTDPLKEALLTIETIELSEFEQKDENILITANFKEKEDLQPNFYLLLEQIEKNNDDVKNCVIKIKNDSENQELINFLKETKFFIYEAIDTGHYTALPQQLRALSQKNDISYDLAIDDQFVFLTASKGEDFAHLIINKKETAYRIISTMGEDEFV